MSERPSAEQIAARSERNRIAWLEIGKAKVAKPARNAASAPRRKDTEYSKRRSTIDRPSEHDEQATVVKWWDLWAPTKGLEPSMLFSIPNAGAGAQRGQAGKMKAEGVRAGIPDLMLALPMLSQANPGSMTFSGLFIELKRTGWRAPKSGNGLEHWQRQQAIHSMLRHNNYKATVAVGAEEAIWSLMDYVERVLARSNA